MRWKCQTIDPSAAIADLMLVAEALSERTIEMVKATVPVLEAHSPVFAREMYSRLVQNEARKVHSPGH